jgi:beta-xylosidase
LLHSRDLVNWRLVGHAARQVPGERYTRVQHGCGIWAPSLRHHAGKFWIFFPTPDEGIYVTTADDPAGRWSEPHLVQAGRGLIDPCPLWDDDGRAYLVHAYAGSRAGIKHRLRVCPMEPDGSRLLGEGHIVFHEPETHPTLEGPKFLKREGWYYILAPAGGVETGWQLALRSRHIYGPYEAKILLAQGRTPINGPHQGALVDTPQGEWWFLHFQAAGVYGRVVHLQPVRWQAGWPLMGAPGPDGIGEPVLEHAKPALPADRIEIPPTSDEFTRSQLAPQWQWHANHRDDWHSLTARPGWLRLLAQPAAERLEDNPHLLLQKFPARTFAVETLVELTTTEACEAGLVIAGRESTALVATRAGDRLRLGHRRGTTTRAIAEIPAPAARLRVHVADGGRCTFAWAGADGPFESVPGDFPAQPGVWIGAKVGLFCSSTRAPATGHADFHYFRFSPG